MSKLRDAVQNYLAMRRALGFKLRQVGAGLLDFVSFCRLHRSLHKMATTKEAAVFLSSAAQPSTSPVM